MTTEHLQITPELAAKLAERARLLQRLHELNGQIVSDVAQLLAAEVPDVPARSLTERPAPAGPLVPPPMAAREAPSGAATPSHGRRRKTVISQVASLMRSEPHTLFQLQDVSERLGIPRNSVQSAMYRMRHHGQLELVEPGVFRWSDSGS